MFQFCFFISIAYSYCIETRPAPAPVEVHYSRVVERSAEMIARYEGLALQAYPDTKGWTIGYGTRSYAGEVITEAEALERFKAVLHGSVKRVMRDFPDATENELVALTSIYYNCWSGWLEIKKK